MFATPRRLLKETFYDGKGTLSLTRVMLAIVALNAFTVIWLCVIWVWHVTVTNQMEAAAPLASAVFGGVAAILSAQVTMAAAQYFVQNKFGSGGISSEQLAPPPAAPESGYLVPPDEEGR